MRKKYEIWTLCSNMWKMQQCAKTYIHIKLTCLPGFVSCKKKYRNAKNMASAGARAYMGVWGRCPHRGPAAEPLVRGQGGEAPLSWRQICHFHLLNFAAICRKGPERRSGDQKKNRNSVPVRSGSKGTLMPKYKAPLISTSTNFLQPSQHLVSYRTYMRN